MIIKIYSSVKLGDEIYTEYKFIQWIATEETVIAICEDLETGQIHQFKLNKNVMAFKAPLYARIPPQPQLTLRRTIDDLEK